MTESPKGIKEVPTEFNIPPYKPLTKEKVIMDTGLSAAKDKMIDILCQPEHAKELKRIMRGKS